MQSTTVRGMLVGIVICGFAQVGEHEAVAYPPDNQTLVKNMLTKYRPVQKEVEIETPPNTEFDQCHVRVERKKEASGWVVTGPAGQVLRRFVDTNGDDVVDQWRYYHHGLEVYRDIDSNTNQKIDQMRWLNTAGSRWGIDSDEDGQIDRWKVLSAEEASRESIRALVSGSEKAMQALLINEDDIRTLGLDAALSKKLLDSVSQPGRKMRAVVSRSKMITPRTRWMRFDGSMPSVIPADSGKAKNDLVVYENALAFVETGSETGLVQIGEMVRVGDVWKLTQIPQPLEGESIEITQGGLLMQPSLPETQPVGTAVASPEAKPLLDQLRKLDQNSPSSTAGRQALARYNAQRAELLRQLIDVSKTDEERAQWTRQMVDGIAAAVQNGGYPDGLERLKSLESELRRSSADSSLMAYIEFRRLLSEYSLRMEESNAEERGEIQQWWLKNLEEFIKRHPKAQDTAAATLQLAVAQELNGEVSDAKKWYQRVAAQSPESSEGIRAQGALRRIDLQGERLTLSGPRFGGGTLDVKDHRGKVVLIYYWATWCHLCTEQLPELRELYEKHHRQGFEIIGVNLDNQAELIRPYLREHRVTWPQIHDAGGLESQPARSFGVILLPTMFLVDSDGKVVDRNASIEDLKTQVPEIVDK